MRALLFALPLFACAERAVIVALPVLAPEVQSLLVARVSEGEVEVHATARDRAVIELEPLDRPSSLELRAYHRPLIELRLAEGRVAPPSSGTFPRRLPDGALQLVTSVEGDAIAPWAPGALDAVSEFRFGVADPCARFVPEIAHLSHASRIGWAANLEPDRVVFGTTLSAPARAHVIDANGVVTDLTIASGEEYGPQPKGAFRDATGALWIGDADGGLYRGRVEGTTLALERVIRPTPHGAAQALAGDPEDPERQLFVATSSGVLARREGDHWVRLDERPVGPVLDPKIAIAWLRPNDVLHGNSSYASVWRWRGTTSIQELVVDDSGAGVVNLTHAGDGRVWIGLGAGLVAVFDGQAITRLGQSGLTLDIHGFAPLGAGFWYTGVFGYVGEWSAEVGFCPVPSSPIAGSSILLVRPLGARWFLAGDSPRGAGSTSYTLLSVDAP